MTPSTRAIAFRGVGYGTRQTAFRGFLAMPAPQIFPGAGARSAAKPKRKQRRDIDDDVLIFLLRR